tara:strand:- start:2 stop:412 length:411 start_codon:yes stop_codon:yes gene_type:complete
MNPACNDCVFYPSDCTGARDDANVAGCFEPPENTTYNSAMIDNDIEDDYDTEIQQRYYQSDLGSSENAAQVNEGRNDAPAARGEVAASTADICDGAVSVAPPHREPGPIAVSNARTLAGLIGRAIAAARARAAINN